MKKLILIGCLMAANFCYGQSEKKDYCSEIRKITSELRGTTFYTSYADWFTKSACVVPMALSTDKNKSFSLNFKMFSEVLDINLYGVYIKFSDGTLYKSGDVKFKVEVTEAARYEYAGLLIVDDTLLDKLIKLKITAVNYALTGDISVNNEQAESIQQHFTCLKNMNK